MNLPQNQKIIWLIDCWSKHGVHTMDQITTSTSLFNVYTCKLYLQALAYKCDHPTPIQACISKVISHVDILHHQRLTLEKKRSKS